MQNELGMTQLFETVPVKISSTRTPKISSSVAAFDYIKEHIYTPNSASLREEFYVIYVRRDNSVIGHQCLGIGDVGGTVVDRHSLFLGVFQTRATGVFLVHNHPSSNINPSANDKNITGSLKYTLNKIGLHLLDHIICAGSLNTYYSFADNDHPEINIPLSTYYLMGSEVVAAYKRGDDFESYLREESWDIFEFSEGVTLSKDFAESLNEYLDWVEIPEKTYHKLNEIQDGIIG